MPSHCRGGSPRQNGTDSHLHRLNYSCRQHFHMSPPKPGPDLASALPSILLDGALTLATTALGAVIGGWISARIAMEQQLAAAATASGPTAGLLQTSADGFARWVDALHTSIVGLCATVVVIVLARIFLAWVAARP